MSESPDIRVVACNYLVGTSAVAQGALCYAVHVWCGERVRILARSRSGRWIEKWANFKKLGNFRLKTLPPEHPRYRDYRAHSWADPDVLLTELQRAVAVHAAALMGVAKPVNGPLERNIDCATSFFTPPGTWMHDEYRVESDQ